MFKAEIKQTQQHCMNDVSPSVVLLILILFECFLFSIILFFNLYDVGPIF